MATPEYIIDSLRDACKALGGNLEKRGIEYVCVVKPHEKGTLEITVVDGKVTDVTGWNESATITVKYLGGQPITKITSNKEKSYVLIQMSDNNTCTFEREPRLIRGSCVVDGKMVSFHIDP